MTGLAPEALHFPVESGPHRMAMGLVAVDPAEAIELDDRYHDEMALRRALLDGRRGEVFGAEPGSEAARAAVLERVADVAATRHPAHFSRDGDLLSNHLTGERWSLRDPPLDPLEVAGRLVQEDLCVVRDHADGPRLAAAVLCFPSRWRLADKLGRPLEDVHGPVPDYKDRLAAPVDRFMRQLRPGRLAARFNWSLNDDPALFQPAGHGRTGVNAAITEANAGETVFLRVERQTLGRIGLDAVLFTIRTHVYPMARVVALEGAAARLAGAVRGLPEDLAAYKSLPPFRDALLAFLDRRRPSAP